jgi:hypothetical protein
MTTGTRGSEHYVRIEDLERRAFCLRNLSSESRERGSHKYTRRRSHSDSLLSNRVRNMRA